MELQVNVELDKAVAVDRNDLAWWFPRLAASGLRVPKTEIIRFEGDLVALLDGHVVEGFEGLVQQVQEDVERLGGYPAFLRTGHGSGKHQWKETCYLKGSEVVASHIGNLVEWSSLVDMFGLPVNTWVVREFLDLRHDFVAFEGMPVAREFRFFFREGQVTCFHPYWPKATIKKASLREAAWQASLEATSRLEAGEGVMLINQVEKAAAHFEGFWSLDMAQLATGEGPGSWVAIDMADGDDSFHWPGCIHNPHPERDRVEEETKVDWSQLIEHKEPEA
jgi:hypothetical protein